MDSRVWTSKAISLKPVRIFHYRKSKGPLNLRPMLAGEDPSSCIQASISVPSSMRRGMRKATSGTKNFPCMMMKKEEHHIKLWTQDRVIWSKKQGKTKRFPVRYGIGMKKGARNGMSMAEKNMLILMGKQ